MPNGQGTYTWANGDNYIGEFKKGIKSGPGKFTSEDAVISGYWIDDEYIGESKYPYKLFFADAKISDIQFVRKGSDKNQIVIRYEIKERKTKHIDIMVTELQGNYTSLIQEPWTKTLSRVTFPIRFQVAGKESYDIVINQPGNWELKVMLVGTNGLNVSGK